MTSALAHVAWEPCFVEARQDRELEAYARKRMGLPNAAVRYFAAAPWVARAQIDLHPEFGLVMHLDALTADLIGIVVGYPAGATSDALTRVVAEQMAKALN